MLAYGYGVPRVMSSYFFSYSDQSPPSDSNKRVRRGSVGLYLVINLQPTSPTFESDDSCNFASGWVCEHRWLPIRRMVGFNNAVGQSAVGNVVTDDHRLAFSRGSMLIQRDCQLQHGVL